jgi:hypothetical protein
MTIIERGRTFLHYLRGVAQRTRWQERQCPLCQGQDTWTHGRSTRRPWTLSDRQLLRIQRYGCRRCQRTFTPAMAVVDRAELEPVEAAINAEVLALYGIDPAMAPAGWARAGAIDGDGGRDASGGDDDGMDDETE